MPGRAPVRTCVGCRGREEKAALIRLVVHEGQVRVDAGATAPGRGAYLHPRADCLEAAERRGSLVRALGAEVGPDGARKLKDIVAGERA
ncbi:MAG TPA: YlxR family protein [Actinomycetota bacterium]|nr:YlxR family protein [Actinomycetota bacterium]